MTSTFTRKLKEMARRVVPVFVWVELLMFLLPTNGKVEGLAANHWDGVRLRFLSGNYLIRALLAGFGACILVALILVFSDYLARFMKPPSK